MTPNSGQCSDSTNVDDAAPQNYDNSGLPRPWRKPAALRAALNLFAELKLPPKRTLTAGEVDQLFALQYHLQVHGFDHYTWRDHQIEYQIESADTAEREVTKLRKLAIAIGMVEPFDTKPGRKQKRYLKLTDHYVQWDWKGAIEMGEVKVEQQRQQRKRFPDAREMSTFISELKAAKKHSPNQGTVEHPRNSREGTLEKCGRPPAKSAGASAEIPCDNVAKSDSLKLSKNYLRTTEEIKGLKEVSRPCSLDDGSPEEASRTTANSPDQRVLDQVVEIEQKSWDSTWQDVDCNEKWDRLQQQLQEQSFSSKPRKLYPYPDVNVLFNVELDFIGMSTNGIDFEDLEAWFAFQEARSFTVELNEIGECCSPGVLFATDAAAIYKAAGWPMPGQEALDRLLKACEQPKQASRSEENDFALEPAGSGEASSEQEEINPVESNVVPDDAVWASDLLEQLLAGLTPERSQSAA